MIESCWNNFYFYAQNVLKIRNEKNQRAEKIGFEIITEKLMSTQKKYLTNGSHWILLSYGKKIVLNGIGKIETRL